jgi:hypothetical protein
MLFKKLTEYIVPTFTASLVIAYAACLGYYDYFGVDITSYIGISDLTLIFAKYVWLGIACVAIFCYPVYKYSTRPAKRTWWDKTIGDTLVKRRAFLVFPLLLLFIIIMIVYHTVLTAVAVGILVTAIVLSFVFVLLMLIELLREKKEISEIHYREWLMLAAVLAFFIFAVPFTIGRVIASDNGHGRVLVKTEALEQPLVSNDSTAVYIGKTADYFFFYNRKTKEATAYRMEKVKFFQISASK